MTEKCDCGAVDCSDCNPSINVLRDMLNGLFTPESIPGKYIRELDDAILGGILAKLATVPREERAEEPVVAKRAREKLELEWGRPSVAGAWTIGGSREEWRAFFDWLDARRPAEPARAKPPEKFSDLLARAMEEPSLEEARVFLAIAETDRIVRQLAGPVPYETTFKYMFAEVEKAWLLRAAGKAEPAGNPHIGSAVEEFLAEQERAEETKPAMPNESRIEKIRQVLANTDLDALGDGNLVKCAELIDAALGPEEPKQAEANERERELAETLAQAMSDWWNQENEATWQDRAERLLGRKAPQPTFAELKAERDQLRAELAKSKGELEAAEQHVKILNEAADLVSGADAFLRNELAKAREAARIETVARSNANRENARLTRELQAERERAAKVQSCLATAFFTIGTRADLPWIVTVRLQIEKALALLQPPTDSAAKGDEKRFVNGDQVHRHYGATGGAGLANNPYVVTGLKAVSASLPTAEEDERIVDGMMAERANGRKETRLKQRASSLPTAEEDAQVQRLANIDAATARGQHGVALSELGAYLRAERRKSRG